MCTLFVTSVSPIAIFTILFAKEVTVKSVSFWKLTLNLASFSWSGISSSLTKLKIRCSSKVFKLASVNSLYVNGRIETFISLITVSVSYSFVTSLLSNWRRSIVNVLSSPVPGTLVVISIWSPYVAIRIAISAASKSILGIAHGFLIVGMQLLITSTVAAPLSNASGVFIVNSSLAVIANTGNSFVSGISISPSG